MGWQQIIAVGGVVLLAFLAWRLGALRTARLANIEMAEKRFAQDFPNLKPSHSFVSTDGQAALLFFEDGTAGAVFVVGDKFATRLWRPGALQNIVSESGRLVIETKDMTRPKLAIKGLEATGAEIWQRRLAALVEEGR